MCFNVPRLPHETHAVPARVVQKVPNHLRLSRILVFGGRHDLGRGWGGVGGLTTLMCGGVHADGDGGGWGGWANNVDVWWCSC